MVPALMEFKDPESRLWTLSIGNPSYIILRAQELVALAASGATGCASVPERVLGGTQGCL